MMLRRALLLLPCLAALGLAGETPTVVLAWTRDGSRVPGLVAEGAELFVKTGEGTERVPWKDVTLLRLSERIDAKLDEAARAAVKELSHDEFLVRAKALDALRRLERAAVPALREAAGSKDPEVAAKARQLLGEMAAAGQGETEDVVHLAGGRTLRGRVQLEALELRTRWGTFRFPISGLEAATRPESAEAGAGLARLIAQAPPREAVHAQAPDPGSAQDVAKRFGHDLENEGMAPGIANRLQGFQVARIDQAPDKATEIKAGTKLNDVYVAWGLRLRSESGAIVATEGEAIAGLSGGLYAVANGEKDEAKGAIELSFVQPGTIHADRPAGEAGGVHEVGCVIGAAPAGTVFMDAFDRTGRLLSRIFNQREGGDAVVAPAEFLGICSILPIVRVRVYLGDPEREGVALRIDDIVFSRVVPADRDPRLAAVETLAGARVVGKMVQAAGLKDAVSVRPLFLPEAEPAWDLKLGEIRRFDPPLPETPATAEKPRKPMGPLHAILLQNGEVFRAHLYELDAKEAVLLLPGGVELRLPRGTLRKVDLWPEKPKEGEEPQKLSVAEGEKPGVEFKQKTVGLDPASPQREDEEAKPADHPAAGMPRMDNAEILRVHHAKSDLVVDPKDGGGEWPIDLKGARFLVFPPDAEAGPQAGARAWMLTLRQGSRFEINLKELVPGALEVEIAGGTATMPFEVVESIERNRD